jgi:enamine deaminase RidA (YjgF/YER057c/UK114 family)
VGDFLFFSGQISVDSQDQPVGDDIRTQKCAVMQRIGQTLKSLGADMDQVVKMTVWLADMNDFAAFNEESRRSFAGGFPVRSAVQSKLFEGALVEIEGAAWVGQRPATHAS